MSAPPGTCKDCSSVHAGHQITADQSEWVLSTLSELIDYHVEADTDRADEISEELAWVFDLVKPLLPLPEGSPWVVTDDDDDDDEPADRYDSYAERFFDDDEVVS